MPALAERDLQRAMKERAFDAVYYFHGEDDYLKDDAVRQLMDAAVDPAMRDFNLDVRRGGDVDAESLETMLDTLPMMAERRMVVVRDVPALKKAARQALDRYLARPAPDTVVVLVAPAGAKADRALLERATTVEFAPLAGSRVPKWIAHHASTQLGVRLTTEAVELLQRAVGNDLPQLAAELDKLASYASASGRTEIEEDDVAAVVGVRRGETLADLLDRVLERDGPGALALVPHVLSQPKMSAVYVVMALSTQTLAVAWGRATRDAGVPAARMEGELLGLLKQNPGALAARPWGDAVRAWARAIDRWTPGDCDAALARLLAADVALKETRLSSDEQLLSSLVLALCIGGAARRAA